MSYDVQEDAAMDETSRHSASHSINSETRVSQHNLPSPRRAASGGIFSKLSFLRSTNQDDELTTDLDAFVVSSEIASEAHAQADDRRASATELSRSQTVTQRKRKGSLRKSALLGGRRFGAEGKDRRSSPLQNDTLPQQGDLLVAGDDVHSGQYTDAFRQHESSIGRTSTPFIIGSASSSKSSLALDNSRPREEPLAHHVPETSALGITTLSSVKKLGEDTSTTEDDDFAIPTARTSKNPMARVGSQASFLSSKEGSSTSYFPPQPPLLRARSSQRLRPSPLQNVSAPAPEPYSYAETEYWGWVILFGTWLLFTVGMGSCLDIWSWAWDVGETPYAPPELEDDPTLPIVGYYPALIVLTGVVAWVWITVAWVGMKYFRHAKIEV